MMTSPTTEKSFLIATKTPKGSLIVLLRADGIPIKIDLKSYHLDMVDLLMIFLIEKIWKFKGILSQLSYENPPELPRLTTEHMQAEALLVAFQQEIGMNKRDFSFLISNLSNLCGFLNIPTPVVSAEDVVAFRRQLSILENDWNHLPIGNSLRLNLH
ncbi:MAG: hypothetical protein AAGB31_15520 [Bdellovibrio sp.]